MVALSTVDDYADCVVAEDGTRCGVHGGFITAIVGKCQTHHVLADVGAERARQFARYGNNDDLIDGTGPSVEWLEGLSEEPADRIQQLLRESYEYNEREFGKPTFRHLVLEEVAEAFEENSPKRLREELVQVAALCVSWIEKIDARRPEWMDVDSQSARVGDMATKKATMLDPREVTYVDADVFFMRIGTNDMVGPCDPDEYTFRRRVR